MTAVRRAATRVTDISCRVVGRPRMIRGARFVLRRARLDVPNDLRTNGELSLQRWVLGLRPPGQVLHVLDVGANVGRWSAAMLASAHAAGRLADLDLHAFEPSECTFSRLAEALQGQPVQLHQSALSDQSGAAVLHVVEPGAGTNSLHVNPGMRPDGPTEAVGTCTLDEYAQRAGLDQLDLVKIDTEGHDFAVLAGAQALFAGSHISVVQFEYNHRWIYSRHYLRDAFGFLAPHGYRLGKLTPWGVEFYPDWEPDLETFAEGNYVACPGPVAHRLPAIGYWNAGVSTEVFGGNRVSVGKVSDHGS